MTSTSRIGRLVARSRNWGFLLLTLAAGCGSAGNGGPDGTAPADGSADVAQDTAADPAPEAPDAAPDSSSCQPPATISYSAPGCGVNARPNCGGPAPGSAPDTCAAYVVYCGCDGQTTVMGSCGWSFQPFLYAGACRDGGPGDGP